MAQHNELGFEGERIAQQYLRQKGYEILEENWVFGKAEIDLIAYLDRKIIFVEVKTRRNLGFGMPEDFVDLAKQQHLERAAEEYIALMTHEGEVRFDIIALVFDQQNNYTLNHIEDAFWPYS